MNETKAQPDRKPEDLAREFVAFLRQNASNKAVMSPLKAAITPSRIQQAWPILARFGGIDSPAHEIVGPFFAYHPKDTNQGNMGTTCSRLCIKNPTFEARFKRLLACEDRQELAEHLRRMLLAAKAKGTPVNWERLFIDIRYWGDRTRADWARNFEPWAGANPEE